jgi:hypothetical protein
VAAAVRTNLDVAASVNRRAKSVVRRLTDTEEA